MPKTLTAYKGGEDDKELFLKPSRRLTESIKIFRASSFNQPSFHFIAMVFRHSNPTVRSLTENKC